MLLFLLSCMISTVFTRASVINHLSTVVTDLEEKTTLLNTCLINIMELNFSSNESILYTHINRNISITLSRLPTIFMGVCNQCNSYDKFLSFRNGKYAGYFIVIENKDVEEVLRMIRRNHLTWNARAKFLIVIEGGDPDEHLWQQFINYYVVNVIVLQVYTFDILTYYPYKYENLHEPHLDTYHLGKCSDLKVLHGMFKPRKIPKQWRNTTVTVAYTYLDPYIINASIGTGIEVELVSLMSTFMKYKISYYGEEFPDWAVYFEENNTYSGALGKLQFNEADFVIGHYHLREVERMFHFDTTFSYMEDDICWSAPTPELLPHWKNIINIYTTRLWTLFGVLLIGSTFLWMYLAMYSSSKDITVTYYKSFVTSFEVMILSLLQMNIVYMPSISSLRLFYIVLFVFCFIVNTGWKSYLTDKLTHDTNDHQINTVHEIIESDYIIGIYYELIDLYCEDNTYEGDYICQHADRAICDASNDCLDRSAYLRDMVTIGTKRIFRYILPQKYRTTTGKPMIHVFSECLAKDYTVQFYTKGHPLFERSNELLMWIRTSGFIDNLDAKLDFEVALSFQKYISSLSLFSIKALDLHEMSYAFLILSIGLLVSAVLLLIEIYYNHTNKSRRKFACRTSKLK